VSQQINLFNPIFLTQKKYFSAATMLQALGLILLGSGLMVAYASVQLAQMRAEANAVTAQLEAAEAQLAAINAAHGTRQKDGLLQADLRRVEAELIALERLAQSLSRGDNRQPGGYSEYMRAFSRQIVDGVWLTGFSIRDGGNEIGLSGGALRPELLPAYLNRLGREPSMRNKSFDMLEMGAPAAAARSSAQAPAFVEFRLQSSERPAPASAGRELQ